MFTKSAEELQARRNRVSQMIANGEVMTNARRAKIRKQQKEAQLLQDKAELALVGLTPSRKRPNSSMGNVTPTAAPEANVSLSRTTKVDTLASTADAILKELQGKN